MPDRFITADVAEAIDRAVAAIEARVPWSHITRPIEVAFPAGAMPRDVAHDLGVVPTGVLVLYQTAPVLAVPNRPWTPDVVWLQMPVPGRAVLCVLRTTTPEAAGAIAGFVP